MGFWSTCELQELLVVSLWCVPAACSSHNVYISSHSDLMINSYVDLDLIVGGGQKFEMKL